jgi:hypothetical protein
MKLLRHFTNRGYKCAGCNYTSSTWYAFDTDDEFTLDDGSGRPNWCCSDCMLDYLVDLSEDIIIKSV